jgi:hypothetical protein
VRSVCSLGPSFTVVQYDDGCLVDTPRCRVFGAGGYGDVPIPLTCAEHKLTNYPQTIFASFIGSIATHPIRREMLNVLGKVEGFRIEESRGAKGLNDYVETIQRSCFTLAPRGYGATSFRLYEAMQLGSVPVYISDKHWIPFEGSVDWNAFSIRIYPEQMESLPEVLRDIIKSGNYWKMREAALIAYDKYFKFDSCFGMIKKLLECETI